MGDAGDIAAGGEEKKASSSSGILRVVWFRQMLRRWQSSSSSSSSATGDGAEPNPSASTDQRSSDGTAPAHQHEHRSPPLPAASSDEWRPLPRVVVVEERGRKCPDAAAAAECSGAGSPMTPVTPDSPADVPRGCFPVYVGAERRRFVVPTAYLGMPVFRRLLEKAEEEFEFHYHGGAVTIPCDTEAFKYILLVMDRHRQGLVDDEGNAKKEDVGEQGCGRPFIVVAGSGSATTSSAANAADGAAIIKCKPILHGP